MFFFVKNKKGGPVSKNTILEFENECFNRIKIKPLKEFQFTKLLYYINYFLCVILPVFYRESKSINKKHKKGSLLFSISMGVKPELLFPHYLNRKSYKSIYFFDVWEGKIHMLKKLIKTYGIDQVFVSSKQAAEILGKQNDIKNINIEWIAEGINTKNYSFKPFEFKDVDVLQLGRKYDKYHEQIVGFCEKKEIKYLYERTPQKLIFDSNKEFYQGLSRSKISICFPQNITHPDIAGNISTMTQRYLQSMLSKCLIVGKLPYDMEILFSYNPIIDADMSNPEGQLEYILKHYYDFYPLIERNYNEVMNCHLWSNRVEQMQKYWNRLCHF